MHISIAWLNRYLSSPVATDEAERSLMEAGFPIETRETLPSGDVMLDVEITSNRGDCLSHAGLAREVAAKTGRALKLPEWKDPEPAAGPVALALKLDNRHPEVCSLFTARVLRGVKIGPSPAWLVSALESVGQRSINNVVDITNFISFELGNPCHVFDLAKLDGHALVVRYAKEGEPLTTLDGKKRTLKADELVVADATRAQSLAGVIGGQDSEVSASTTDIVFEMATWDPVTVRRAARRLGVRTDASYRFERIVDPRTIDWAARRAVALIFEVAGGKLCEGVLTAGKSLADPLSIRFRPTRCRELAGIQIETEEMVRHLRAVGVEIELIGRAGDDLRCIVPAWRPDLFREIDLIEEVVRLKGLDAIPVSPKLPISVSSAQPRERAVREVGAILTGLGFHETVTFSFVSRQQSAPFALAGMDLIEIDDARRAAEPVLRPSVLPSLIACRRANQDRRSTAPGAVRLFEIASIFGQESGTPAEAGLSAARGRSIERRHLALLMDVPGARPGAAETQTALRLLRGTVESLVRAMTGGGESLIFEPAAPPCEAFDRGAYANVVVGGRPLGYIALLNGALVTAAGLDAPVVGAELNLDTLVELYPPKARIVGLPAFPAIDRDLTVTVGDAVSWAKIDESVARARLQWLDKLEFVGTYRGKQVGPGKKSVTMRLYFRDEHRTLRREEVDPQIESLVAMLKSEVGAEVRTA